MCLVEGRRRPTWCALLTGGKTGALPSYPNGSTRRTGGNGDGGGGKSGPAAIKPTEPAECDILQYERWIQLQMEDVDALQVVGAARRDANQAIADQQTAFEGFKIDMQFELQVPGMSNRERETAIALRRAGVVARSEEGQQLSALTDEQIRAREHDHLDDNLKSGKHEQVSLRK